MASSDTYPVDLYIYDLTRGMARQFAPMILGTGFDLEGIWHTAIIVHGIEWFFGGGGIETQSPPGSTMLGSPLKTQRLGMTNLDLNLFRDYLGGIGQTQFAGSTYDLFRHNCNNFSHEVARFLCPSSPGVPRYILDLPDRLLQTPLGSMLRPMIEEMIPTGESLASQSYLNTEGKVPNSSGKTQNLEQNLHIPIQEVLGFRSDVNAQKLSKKLSELNVDHTNDSTNGQTSIHHISDDNMQVLNDILACPHTITETPNMFDDIWKCIKLVLMTWPKDQLFPILDLLRWQLGKKNSKGLSAYVVTEILDMALLSKDRFLSSKAAETAVRLTLRIISNCFLHSALHKILMQRREELIGALNNLTEDIQTFNGCTHNSAAIEQGANQASSNIEVAIATIALNFSIIVADLEVQLQEEAAFQIISALGTTYIDHFHDPEALYRVVVAIGNLLWLDTQNQGSVKDLALALDIKSALTTSLTKSASGGCRKIEEAINECCKLLS